MKNICLNLKAFSCQIPQIYESKLLTQKLEEETAGFNKRFFKKFIKFNIDLMAIFGTRHNFNSHLMKYAIEYRFQIFLVIKTEVYIKLKNFHQF